MSDWDWLKPTRTLTTLQKHCKYQVHMICPAVPQVSYNNKGFMDALMFRVLRGNLQQLSATTILTSICLLLLRRHHPHPRILHRLRSPTCFACYTCEMTTRQDGESARSLLFVSVVQATI